jgi:hypothetical protein
MKYKRYLQKFLDKQFKSDLEEFFGKNSYITISNMTYIRSKNSYLISVNLYLDEPDKIDLLFPSALEMLIQRAWNVIGDKKEIILQSSFDLIPQ